MKKKWKGALVGGIVGFVAPWLLFIFAVAKGAPEIGFALQPVIILSLLMLMTGILIGYVIGSGKKKAMIIALGGFFIPWLYFIYRYLNYISLPRIEQRGISGFFFTILFISLIFLLIGLIIGGSASKNEK